MKRSLSLVLALVMILGSFSTVFAAEATAVEKAGKFLNEKGILSGYAGSGDLGLEDNLLRQDTLVLVARLLGEFDEAKAHKGEVTYEDVKDKTYVPLAAWAKENNTFIGHSDAKFGFGENLKAQEYAKVLLTALGYKVAPNGDSDIKWADALAKAKEFGILADVKVEDTTEITRGEMALMTFNALGVTIKGSKETLAEKLGITMPAAEVLKVEKVYTENLAEMEIELSNAKLANQARLENEDNYTITGPNNEKVKVYNAEVIGNNVRLTLVPYGRTDKTQDVKALLKDREYSLTIRNIDKVINEKTIKKIKAVDNAIPTVESVDFIGTYGIKVVTSEPIRNAQERFFRVDDKRTSMFIEQYGRTLILSPYQDASFDKDAKELVIGKLEDFAGFTAVEKTHDLVLASDDVKPVVKNVYRTGQTLLVEFEEDVFHKSIKGHTTRRELGNVSFMDGRVPFYALEDSAVKVNERLVRYTFEREIPRNTEVEIVDVQNHFGTKMDKVSMMPELIKDDSIPYIIDPVEKMNSIVYKEGTLSADGKTANAELELVFDKEDMTGFVDNNGNVKVSDLKEHFALYEIEIAKRNEVTELITAAKVEKDTVTVTLTGIKVQNANKDNDYVLEVKRFLDKTGNRMETTYVDFEVIKAADAFAVTKMNIIPSDEYRYASEIVLTFNKALDKEEAEKVNNFYLGKNGTVRADRAYLEKDGKTVSLLLRDKTITQVRDLELLEVSSNVKETSKKHTVANRFWNLKTGLAIPTPEVAPEVSPITYKNGIVIIEETSIDMSVGTPHEITVDAKGEKDNQLEARLYDSKGKVVEVLLDSFDAAGDASVITTKLSSAVRGTYKLVAKVVETGETRELTINVLSDTAKVTVDFKGTEIDVDNTFTSTTPDFEVAYNANLATDVKVNDFNVIGVDGTEVINVAYDGLGNLTIIFRSEDGLATETKVVEIDNAAIDAGSKVTPATKTATTGTPETITIVLKDELGNAVKGLAAAKFVITEDAASNATLTIGAVTETSTPGTYTFTVDNTATETVNYRITVDGVVLTIVPAITN